MIRYHKTNTHGMVLALREVLIVKAGKVCAAATADIARVILG